MKPIFLLAVLAATVSFGHAQNNGDGKQNQVIQAVLQTEREIDEALIKADFTKLDQLVSDDFMLTGPIDGVLRRKAQWFANIKAGSVKYISMKRENVEVRLYGETAVATGIVHIHTQDAAKADRQSKNRCLRVYVNQHGRWQLVAHQATKIEQK